MRFGVMEGVLESDTPESIDEAAEAGFDGIELDVNGPHPADDPVWTPEGRHEIRERARSAGIRIASLCLGYLNAGSVTAEDPGTRATAHTSLRRAIDAATALDVEAILVPFFWRAEIEERVHEERAVEHLSALAPIAEAAEVTLAIETTLPAHRNLDIVEAVDSPAVGVYHDTGNPVQIGNYDPVAEIREYGDRMARLHLKDTDGEEGRPLGEGVVDFAGVSEAIEEVGYDDWLVLETTHGEDPVADAAANLAFAREHF